MECCKIYDQHRQAHVVAALPRTPSEALVNKREVQATRGQDLSIETETDSSDRVLSLLESIYHEQAALRGFMHQQQQGISKQLFDLDASLDKIRNPSNGVLVEKERSQHELEKNVSCHIDKSLCKESHGEKDAHSSHENHSQRRSRAMNHKAVGGGDAVDAKSHPSLKSQVEKIMKHADCSAARLVPLPEKIISHPVYEIATLGVILANTFTMFTSLYVQGLHEGWKLGLRRDDGRWTDLESTFSLLEIIFNGFYLLELLLRFWVYRLRFFRRLSNCMDALIVVFGCVDSFIFAPLNINAVNVSVLRLVRLARILRLGKFLNSSNTFTEIRVLIRTLVVAMRGVFWSMILLTGIVGMGGIFMTQLAMQFVDDDSIALERRQWLYRNFGTTPASLYTMFECTFTTSWPLVSRPLIEEVSYNFAFFWVFWIVVVNFMTMRVVAALFLKQTLAIAAHDQEKQAMLQLRRRAEFAERLHAIFEFCDKSGDGLISEEELDNLLTHPLMVDEFHAIGLDVDDVHALFVLLSSEDECADYDEFVKGALAMCSSSPTLDAMKSFENQFRLSTDLKKVIELLTNS